MDNAIEPVPGNWYQNLDNGQLFQVVAFDDIERLVELQHFDGDLEELSLHSWRSMDIKFAEAPEDWTGPMDDVEREDLGYDQPATTDTARRIAQETPGEGPESYGDASENLPADRTGRRDQG
jgi:hypothetical protein